MGNLSMCPQKCYLWVKSYNQKTKALYQLYKNDYGQSMFSSVCLRVLKEFKQKDENEIFETEIIQRKSIMDSIQYEEESLNSTVKDLPRQFSEMKPDEKKKQLEELIKKTYIILDLSDIFEESLDFYNSEVKKGMLSSEDSFVRNSQINNFNEQLVLGLRKFDSGLMSLLRNYVDFSLKVSQIFLPENMGFASRLVINLKSVVINTWKETEDKTLEQLFSSIRLMINILHDTLVIGFNLDQRRDKIVGGKGTYYNFFSEANVWTLLAAIVFSDDQFNTFVEKAVKDKLHNRFLHYKKTGSFQNSDLKALLKKGRIIKKSKLANLFDPKENSNNYFSKSVKLLNKINKRNEPILKLKLVSELEKQIFKEFQSMKEQEEIDRNFDRETLALIVHWLLNREKETNTYNITSLIITYTCNHPQYLVGEKGSALVTFMSEIETILNEKIAFD